MIATSAAFFMIVLDTSIVNLALPQIKDVFQADLTSLQWLVDGYALVFASLLLNAGALGDRYGAKRVFTLGLFLFCVASAACGLAPSLGRLQFARAMQGISAALLLPNSLAALNHTVEDADFLAHHHNLHPRCTIRQKHSLGKEKLIFNRNPMKNDAFQRICWLFPGS